MKKIEFVLLAALVAFSALGCKGKSYAFEGENPHFTASVVEEKNESGKKTAYFALNEYRLAFDSKKTAVAYFNAFKKEFEDEEKTVGEGMGGRIVINKMEQFDLFTVRNAGGIRYVNLDSEPNYAETGSSYSSMSVNELLDLYETESRAVLSVMTELSSRKLNSKQEKRLYQIAESLAGEFDSEF